MNFITWTIFIIWISFADNVPVNETVSPKQIIDITANLTEFLGETFDAWMLSVSPLPKKAAAKRSYSTNIHKHTFDDVTEQPVHNLTMAFNVTFGKFQILLSPVNCQAEWNIVFYMGSVSIKAYLRDTNQYVATEINPLNVIIRISNESRNYDPDIENLDQIKLKPLKPDYQYRTGEETKVKQIVTAYMREYAMQTVNHSMIKHVLSGLVKAVFVRKNFDKYYQHKVCNSASQNHEEKSYFVNDISSIEGILRNITIRGSWDIFGGSLDLLSLKQFFTIQFANVQGTMLEICPCSLNKNPVELSFKADYVNAIADIKAGKLNIKFENYLVRDAKSNTVLDEDQSKSIMDRIESAIESSILTRPRSETPHSEDSTSTPEMSTPRQEKSTLQAEEPKTHSINTEKSFGEYLASIFLRIFQ